MVTAESSPLSVSVDRHGALLPCESSKLPSSAVPVKQEGEGWPSNVEIIHCLIYAALKKSNEGDHEVITSWNEDLPGFIESGRIKANPVVHRGEGLDKIGEGLEYLKSGKVGANHHQTKVDCGPRWEADALCAHLFRHLAKSWVTPSEADVADRRKSRQTSHTVATDVRTEQSCYLMICILSHLNEAALTAALLVDPPEAFHFQLVYSQARRAEEEGDLDHDHAVYRAENVVQGVVLCGQGCVRNSASRLRTALGLPRTCAPLQIPTLTAYAVMGMTHGVASVAFYAGRICIVQPRRHRQREAAASSPVTHSSDLRRPAKPSLLREKALA